MSAEGLDELAIECEQLHVQYGDTTAVDGLSFQVKPGELFGLLGRNGAGKSTTISTLATLKRPSSGRVRVCGYDVTTQALKVRERLGVLFQDTTLDDRLTGLENLTLHARVFGVAPKERRARIEEATEMCKLGDALQRETRTYSGGMKRRLELARVLLHRPSLLILDEPTAGLDAQTRRELWEHLDALRQRDGLTLLLTTHYIEEAERADRVLIVDRGRSLAVGTPDEIRTQAGAADKTLEDAYISLTGDGSGSAEQANATDVVRDALSRRGRR